MITVEVAHDIVNKPETLIQTLGDVYVGMLGNAVQESLGHDDGERVWG